MMSLVMDRRRSRWSSPSPKWKQFSGALPGPLTEELPAGDELPVGNVSYGEAEAFCLKVTDLGHRSASLPLDWAFRLPTEAQWEYSCRAGTTTATSAGNTLSSLQANFKGKPYNGAEPGPSLGRAVKVGSYPPNPWGLHDMHGNSFEWCRDWFHSKLPGRRAPDLSNTRGEVAPIASTATMRPARRIWASAPRFVLQSGEMPTKGVTFDFVKACCLALPDVEEAFSTRGTSLKILGKLFTCPATHKSAEPGTLMVRIGFEQRAALLASRPDTYYLTDHYINYPAILVRLSRIDRPALKELLGSSWEFVKGSFNR